MPQPVLNLAPVAFLPSNNTFHYAVEEGGFGSLCALKGAGYFVAPFRVDNGAVIERISVFLEDRNKDSFGMMSLVRRTPDKVEMLAVTPISTDDPAIETLSTDAITTPIVDNERYAYLLQVVLTGPGVCLRGAQVTYRTP